MIVVPGTSEIHADTFARALGCRVSSGIEDAECAMFVGIHPKDAPLVEAYRAKGTRVLAYWIGSDSLSAGMYADYRARIPAFDAHLCVHQRIQEELERWKVSSHVVYPCARTPSDEVPIEGKCVGVYAPTPVPGDLYMYETCVTIARENPELPFLFYGAQEALRDLPENAKDAGRMTPEDTRGIYDRVSCVLRLCLHDGNPIGGIEAKMRGRHVIENYPYAGFLFAETVEDANAFLRDPKTHELDAGPYPAWYREQCSREKFKAKVEKIVRGL